MKSWAYSPTYVTTVAEPIMKSIHMTKNQLFSFVAIITQATKPAFSLIILTAEHHFANLDVSLDFCLEEDI